MLLLKEVLSDIALVIRATWPLLLLAVVSWIVLLATAALVVATVWMAVVA